MNSGRRFYHGEECQKCPFWKIKSEKFLFLYKKLLILQNAHEKCDKKLWRSNLILIETNRSGTNKFPFEDFFCDYQFPYMGGIKIIFCLLFEIKWNSKNSSSTKRHLNFRNCSLFFWPENKLHPLSFVIIKPCLIIFFFLVQQINLPWKSFLRRKDFFFRIRQTKWQADRILF